MLRTSLAAFFTFCFLGMTGQVFWTEDFGVDAACNSAVADGFNSGNGAWSVSTTGTNGMQPNVWYVSPTEAGTGEGNCGDGCLANPALNNNTLHVSTNLLGDVGAAYLETGFGFTDTDVRAESPAIDCSGQTDIDLSFLYMHAGAATDICVLQYFDGVAWTDLQTLPTTPLGCAPQGQWTSFTTTLPASANNNPNVRIGFRWVNIDDGVANDPSIGLDDITLSGPDAGPDPIFAGFTASATNICAGDCVDFTDESDGDNINSWTWTFNGAATASSGNQNPAGICYNTPGSYDVTLEIAAPGGVTDVLTLNDFIVVEDCSDPPVAAFSVSDTEICAGDCVSFTDESTGGAPTEWEWTFTGAVTTTSSAQNPASVCYDNPGNYSVTLTVTNADGSDTQTEANLIVVEDCSEPPVAAFSSNVQLICEGDCINFTDESTGGAVETWEWTFDGADTPISGDQNPQGICYTTPGSYTVILEVSNLDGDDILIETDYITVQECAGPEAGFVASELVICEGDCIDFTNQSIGGATEFTWTFEGADTPESNDTDPVQICYQTAGEYAVTLVAGDGTDSDELSVPGYITVEFCEPEPLPEIEIGSSTNLICLGDCVDFTDLTPGNTSNWSWSFPGAVPAFSFNQNPLQICYQTEGVFDVTLQLEVEGETIDSTFANFITVIDTCGPVANFEYTPIVCLGQCYDFVNTSTGGTDYFWTFEGAATPTSEEENPIDICFLDQTGIFNVTLTVVNQFGSSTSITQQITVVNPPNVNAGPDQTIVQGMTTTVSASAGNGTGEFVWQPFEDVICFSCPSTSTYPLNETTTFVVYYEQSGGCQSSDTITVFVEESFAFGLPNSFSPNGDGINDILYVRGSNLTKMRLIVYNRYGQKVFESDSQKNGWDGTMNGRELNAGVFGYYLEVFLSDGARQVRKGDITLVR